MFADDDSSGHGEDQPGLVAGALGLYRAELGGSYQEQGHPGKLSSGHHLPKN
jgi:hypothetical protein